MRVVEVNSIDALPSLRLAWRSLLSETPGAGFHQSCEWLEAVFRRQPHTSRLRILLVTGGGETIGILPLVLTEQTTPWGPARVIGYPRDPWSPFQGPVGPQPMATLMTALRYLSGQQDWDALELRDVNCDALDYERTRTALQVADLRYQESDESPCPMIHLPGSDDDAGSAWAQPKRIETVPPSLFDEMTYQRHRPRGAMYDDAEPGWDLFERCLALRCEDRGRTNTNHELLCDLHAAACRSGAADLNLLRHGKRIVACHYNIQLGGTLLTIFSGQLSGSPASGYEPHAVSRHLAARMLQNSVAQSHDLRWFPGSEFPGTAWRSTPQRRTRFVHHRQRGARRLIRHLTGWLPLTS